MRIYLDNCCYNRPFDDQHNLATALESFAKLQIQALMRTGELEYVWSDSLCHEVVKNPFPRRFKSIVVWMGGAAEYVETTDEIIERAKDFEAMGVKKMDALHLASAEAASCDWFFTTDKGILRKSEMLVKCVWPIRLNLSRGGKTMTDFRFESDQALGARCMDVLLRNVGVLETERFIAYLSRESADYTEWRQNQFDELTIEELGRATRESGKHIKSVLQADAAVASLRHKE